MPTSRPRYGMRERPLILQPISQEESDGPFQDRVLYAVLPALTLPAPLSFNSVRTLRANSMGRNGFSK